MRPAPPGDGGAAIDPRPGTGRRLARPPLTAWAPIAWAIALSAILLWPITRSGYLLGHDMVFTPRQPLDLAGVGVSSASPRAVPLDALVAIAERAADGAVVGRLALIVPLLAAGVGAATLLGGDRVAARLAACGFAIWNPFVVERLALGQWALLWCYAALPWLVLAVTRGRGSRGLLSTGAAVAAASIVPTGGLIAAVVATGVAVAARRDRRTVVLTTAVAILLQLPWIVPSLVGTASATSDPRGIAAFAARGEFAGGPLLSLLGGGGVWNRDVVPASRSGALPWLGLALLVAVAWYGLPRLAAAVGRRAVTALVVIALAGLLLAIAASTPGLDAVMRAAVERVPGAGLLRDAQKWVLPLALVEALVAGAAVDRLADHLSGWNWRAVLVIAALAAPVLLLPDATRPVHATGSPVRYPPDWPRVVADARSGTAAVVPFASYRVFPWAPGRSSMLDPAPRLLQIPTVVDDRLAVSGTLLRGEDPRATAVGDALSAGGDPATRLAALGIRWVVVERDTPGFVPHLAGLTRVYAGRHVWLYRVPGYVVTETPASWRVVTVLAADAVAVCTLLVLVLMAGSEHRSRRKALI